MLHVFHFVKCNNASCGLMEECSLSTAFLCLHRHWLFKSHDLQLSSLMISCKRLEDCMVEFQVFLFSSVFICLCRAWSSFVCE